MPTLLIVDDEPEVLELTTRYLEDTEGFEILTAGSAKEALEVLEGDRVDVVVSDYQMPGMDGIDLLKEVRRRHEPLPFVLFTGRGREEVAIQALNEGANFYLQKGGEPRAQFAELASVVRQLDSGRRAEEALEHNARRFRSLIENISDLVCLFDREGRMKYLSPSMNKVLGHDPDGLIGVPIEDMIHPEDLDSFHDSLERILKDPDTEQRVELRMIHDDGSWRRMEVDLTADREFEATSLILNARDVTERRRMEDALRESRGEMELILENLAEHVIYKDRESRVIRVNRKAAESLGVSPEEIVGRYCYELWHGRDSPCENCPVMEAMDTGRTCTREVPIPDGWRWVSGVPIRDREGRIVGAVETALDVTERKKAEEALQESEERYRMVTESSPVGIYIFQDGRFRMVNEALTRMSGHSREELLTLDPMELVHPDFREDLARYAEEAFKGEVDELPDQPEFMIVRKDGDSRWVRATPSLISHRGRAAILGNVMDVTEKRRADEAIRESEERYRTVFENTGAATIIIEEDTTISLVNEEFESLTGYTKKEAEGRLTTPDIICPEDRKALMEYHRLRREGSDAPRHYTFGLLTKHGESRECHTVISVIPGTSRSVASLTDLTEVKEMGREIERMSREQAKLLDSINVQIWYIRDPETYGLTNEARAEFLGMSKEEIAGKKLWEIVPEGEWDSCLEGNREAFTGKRVVNEEWVTTHNGEMRCTLVEKVPRFNKEGEVEYVVCTATDITELKNMKSALQMANDKLRVLFGVTRHDILNQLTVINGYLELLRDPSQMGSLEEYLDRMRGAAERIRGHLQFTKEIAAIGNEPPRWMRVSEPIHKALSQLDLEGIEVMVDDRLDDLQMYSDSMIWKVFYNLAHNTLRHAEGATRISIFPEEGGEGINIVYEDDGPGLPRGVLGRSRGGLFLIREILSIMDMEIRQERAEGARLLISIPASRARRV
ncbi:MAG: PAS domain S-box protein [Methanomassiliicoccales archaeon]